jgi:hypothetical protein
MYSRKHRTSGFKSKLLRIAIDPGRYERKEYRYERHKTLRFSTF